MIPSKIHHHHHHLKHDKIINSKKNQIEVFSMMFEYDVMFEYCVSTLLVMG